MNAAFASAAQEREGRRCLTHRGGRLRRKRRAPGIQRQRESPACGGSWRVRHAVEAGKECRGRLAGGKLAAEASYGRDGGSRQGRVEGLFRRPWFAGSPDKAGESCLWRQPHEPFERAGTGKGTMASALVESPECLRGRGENHVRLCKPPSMECPLGRGESVVFVRLVEAHFPGRRSGRRGSVRRLFRSHVPARALVATTGDAATMFIVAVPPRADAGRRQSPCIASFLAPTSLRLGACRHGCLASGCCHRLP